MSTRPSTQQRTTHPHPEAVGAADPRRTHPRAIRLARIATAIESAGNGCAVSQLVAAGFSLTEIAEHAPEAERIMGGGCG